MHTYDAQQSASNPAATPDGPRDRPQYRPDVDGLRAIAVVLVLIFHAGLGFPGGFTGVDVFFVISGFVITRIIHAEMLADNFSLARFYERRARRLVPALIPVVLASLAFGYFFYLPKDFTNLTESAVAAAAFASNWFFMATSGYFAAPPDTKPLLHTWTLAVEGQFYLLFPPLLLLVIAKARKYALLAVSALALASLAFSAIGLTMPSLREGMYMNAFGRFFEILLGSIVAIAPRIALSERLAALLRWFGLAAILTAGLLITEEMPFPGLLALVPTIGAALVILAGNQGRDPALTVLTSKTFVYVGNISYSLYLWHWPILVAIRYFDETPSRMAIIAGIAAAFALAAASYHLIEQPFLRKRLAPRRVHVFAFSALCIAALASAAATARATNGMPFRFAPELNDAIRLADHLDRMGCRRTEVAPGLKACVYGKFDATRKDLALIVWGDSLATSPRKLFADMAANGKVVVMFSSPACGPLLGTWKIIHDPQQTCRAKNERIVSFIKRHTADLLMIAAWNELSNVVTGPTRLVSAEIEPKSADQLAKVFHHGFDQSITAAGDRKIFILAQPPRYPMDPASYVIKQRILGSPLKPFVSRDAYEQKTTIVKAAAAAHPNVTYIDAIETFCPAADCVYTRDGIPLYHDGVHLNSTGSKMISNLVRSALPGTQ